MKRIAYCISGQLRDEHITFVDTARLARDHNVDVFVSTWSRRGSKATGIIDVFQAERMFGSITALALPPSLCSGANLNRAIPGFAEILNRGDSVVIEDDIRSYFPTATIDVEDEKLCLDFVDPEVTDTNSIRMLYKIWRCNEMKRRAEKLLGRKYDAVVRFRADVVPAVENFEAIVDSLGDGAAHIPNASPHFLNDVLSISNSDTSDIIASLFAKAILSPQRKWQMIHLELASHLAEIGVTVRGTNFLHIKFDPQHQIKNRKALAAALADNLFDKNFFESNTKWSIIKQIVDASILLNNGSNAEAALLSLSKLDVEGFDVDLLFSYTNTLAECYSRLDKKNCAIATLHTIVAGIHLSSSQNVEEYIRHRVSLETVAIQLLDVAPDVEPADLIEQLMFGTEVTSSEMSRVSQRMIETAGSEWITNTIAQMIRIFADSVGVRSMQFHRLLSEKVTTDIPRQFALRMIKQFPTSWQGHENLSFTYEKDRDYEAASKTAKDALVCNPNSPGLMTRLGMMYFRAGALQQAEEMFRAAGKVWLDERPWGGLVETLMQAGRIHDANEILADGLSRFPRSEWLLRLSKTMT